MSKQLQDLVKDYCQGLGYDTLQAALRDFRGDSYAPYYSHINELYDAYESELWDMLEEYSEENGIPLLEIINNMHKSYTHRNVSCMQDVKQWLVWFGLENVAHRLADELEEQE